MIIRITVPDKISSKCLIYAVFQDKKMKIPYDDKHENPWTFFRFNSFLSLLTKIEMSEATQISHLQINNINMLRFSFLFLGKKFHIQHT